MGIVKIIFRDFALHVDYCPIESRVWRGKPYANFIDDCASCPYFTKSYGADKEGNDWMECSLMNDDPEALRWKDNTPVLELEDEMIIHKIDNLTMKRAKYVKLTKYDDGVVNLDWPTLGLSVKGKDLKEAKQKLSTDFKNLWNKCISGNESELSDREKYHKEWFLKNVK